MIIICGIAGISLSPSSTIPVRQLAHELLLHSEERGKVASGFAWQGPKKTIFHKDDVPGGHLSLTSLPKEARLFITHTRNATYGDPADNENNHPLLDPQNKIVLVHNGVVTNHTQIRTHVTDALPEVDSTVIPWLLATDGVEALSEIDGWAALAWLDVRTPGMLHLARTKGSAPMMVLSLKDGSLIFGSTFQIIHAALIRVGAGDQIAWGWEVPDHTYMQVQDGQLTLVKNLAAYTWASAQYKTGTSQYSNTPNAQELKRLQDITNGGAKSYGKDTPVHAPPVAVRPVTPALTPAAGRPVGGHVGAKTPPTAASLAGAGVSSSQDRRYNPETKAWEDAPASGKGYYTTPPPVSTSTGGGYAPGQPKSAVTLKPGEDPLAKLMAATANMGGPAPTPGAAPKPMEQPTYTSGGTGSASGSKSSTQYTGQVPKLTPEEELPEAVVEWIEYYITYTDGSSDAIRGDHGFAPEYAEYIDNVNWAVRTKQAKDWGIVGIDGVAYSMAEHLDIASEREAIIAIMQPQIDEMVRDYPAHGTALFSEEYVDDKEDWDNLVLNFQSGHPEVPEPSDALITEINRIREGSEPE